MENLKTILSKMIIKAIKHLPGLHRIQKPFLSRRTSPVSGLTLIRYTGYNTENIRVRNPTAPTLPKILTRKNEQKFTMKIKIDSKYILKRNTASRAVSKICYYDLHCMKHFSTLTIYKTGLK